ncbi:MAG: hypothetical protein A4E60_03157 [Syntrophorhabdus sp. PtaB.Bin047]|nr:MAG: hypothetical protein A4E60_03157 [Syntrophorhabdus sp. PtaB.Bin047]
MRGSIVIIVLLLGIVVATGCVSPNFPAGDAAVRLPLNEGAGNLDFLSEGEVWILRDINKARASAAVPLEPLKASRGLSQAAKDRAEEIARSDAGVLTSEEERNRLFERVRRFGTLTGSVAEVRSHGYPEDTVVKELLSGSLFQKGQSRPYFMDGEYAVMGTGCTMAVRVAPLCVIIVASEFKEGR